MDWPLDGQDEPRASRAKPSSARRAELSEGRAGRRLSQAQTDGRHYEATGRQNAWAGHRKLATLPWNLIVSCRSRWPGSTSWAERTRHAPHKSPRTQQRHGSSHLPLEKAENLARAPRPGGGPEEKEAPPVPAPPVRPPREAPGLALRKCVPRRGAVRWARRPP